MVMYGLVSIFSPLTFFRICCFALVIFVGSGREVRWCWVNFQYRGVLQF